MSFILPNYIKLEDLHDINELSDSVLPKILVLIIQYIKEDENLEFLFNDILYTACLTEDDFFRLYPNFSTDIPERICQILIFNPYAKSDDNERKHKYSLLYKSLCTHLTAIGLCFFSYSFIYSKKGENKKHKKGFTALIDGDEYKIDLSSDNQSENHLKSPDITTILTSIIKNYHNNFFYYTFSYNKIFKITIDYKKAVNKSYDVINTITPYEIINKDRDPHIVDPKTGLKISLGRQIFPKYDKYDEDYFKYHETTYKTFNGEFARIIGALTFQVRTCHWCTPQKDAKNEKVKCTNCRNLSDELKEFCEQSTNPTIKRTDFSKLLSEVSINNVKNIAELRGKRRDILYSFLNKNKKYAKNKGKINEIKKLIDKCFTLNVKP